MSSLDFADDFMNPRSPGARVLERTRKIAGRAIIPGWNVRFPAQRLIFGISVVTMAIIGLGVLRELFVGRYGLETPLRDLGQIALDSEGTLAAWFSSLMMMASAAMLFVMAALARRTDGFARARWMLLAILFVAMSVDETVSFHEVTMDPLRQLFGLGGVLHFSWVVIASPVMLILVLYFLPFLLRLPWQYAAAFMASGLIYVGGALGMEFVGGYFITTYGETSLQYVLAFLIEESLEMIGLSCFLAALFCYLKNQLSGHALNLTLGH